MLIVRDRGYAFQLSSGSHNLNLLNVNRLFPIK